MNVLCSVVGDHVVFVESVEEEVVVEAGLGRSTEDRRVVAADGEVVVNAVIVKPLRDADLEDGHMGYKGYKLSSVCLVGAACKKPTIMYIVQQEPLGVEQAPHKVKRA